MAERVFVGLPKRFVNVKIDGHELDLLEIETILDACRKLQIDTPTLCQIKKINIVNV